MPPMPGAPPKGGAQQSVDLLTVSGMRQAALELELHKADQQRIQ